MKSVKEIIEIKETGRKADEQAYKEMDGDLCMLCGAYGADKRSLTVDCFYDIKEVVPEALNLTQVEDIDGYYLRICKSCRGHFLEMMGKWRDRMVSYRSFNKDHDGNLQETDPARNIPVRINGRIVMMDEAEFEEYREKHHGK